MGQTHPRPSSRAQEINTIEQAIASIRSALDVLRRAGRSRATPSSAAPPSMTRSRGCGRAAAIASATERWPATKVGSEEAPPPPAPGERRGTG